MSFMKTYFLCPTSEFIHPPPFGKLCLGSIIRSTSTPQYSLNSASIVETVDKTPPIVEINWKKTVSVDKGLTLGVYAQFLQLATGGLPLGPELNVENSRKITNAFAFDTVTTYAFEPTQDYVQEAVKAPSIQAWLKEPKQRFKPSASLFLVTGLKIVKGAKIKYSTAKSSAINGNLGADVAPLGMTLGPKGHWSRADEDEIEFDRDSEFVFAFSVTKLKFGRKLSTEEHTKGAFLAIGGGEEEDSQFVVVEDVDGTDITTAKVVADVAGNGNVYCVSDQSQ